MKMNIEELETADYDILENIKVAFYRLWKMKIVVLLMTLIGFLAFGVYVGLAGVKTSYFATASIYSAVYGSYEDSMGGVTVMNQYASLGLQGFVTVQQAACRSTALLQMNSEAWWQMVISVLVGPAQIQRLMERN